MAGSDSSPLLIEDEDEKIDEAYEDEEEDIEPERAEEYPYVDTSISRRLQNAMHWAHTWSNRSGLRR